MPAQVLDKFPVTSLKGVGPGFAKRLDKLGIHCLQDFLFHLPIRYEDRTRIVPIAWLCAGQKVLVEGRVQQTEIFGTGRRSLVCRISDGGGVLSLRFFHFSARQANGLMQGVLLRCFGEVRATAFGIEMVHPEYQLLQGSGAISVADSLTPVYPLTEGLHQKVFRRLIEQVFGLLEENNSGDEGILREWLPDSVLEAMKLPRLYDAIRFLHAPPPDLEIESFTDGRLPEQKRLVFEEILAHHMSFSRQRSKNQKLHAPVLDGPHSDGKVFLDGLPFSLTRAQQRVISEIEKDFLSGSPMVRLVQGDVGSGKTVVAAYTSLFALAEGYQVALMAPSELLAEQHFLNFSRWLQPFDASVVLLTGQSKGKTRNDVLEQVRSGQAGVVIGTHALFQEKVLFSRLAYIIIDEQHRFGVQQRLALRDKGLSKDFYPHQLFTTATPIPRTLAMVNFSDLDISIIDELPPGRKQITTSVISAPRRESVIRRIFDWVATGRQVYWVCTLIDDSEALQCEAAENTWEMLKQSLPSVRVGLVHGRMKGNEKDETMRDFKEHNLDVLVATTVIEVGVDIPNAGLMIIDNAERLGLSQLHQLRGRVGRNSFESYCILMYQPPLSKAAHQRLGILRETNDGFRIAECDLDLRGPGEVMGTRQTGQIQFKIANLARDRELLPKVLEVSETIHNEHSESIEPIIKRWLGDLTQYGEV